MFLPVAPMQPIAVDWLSDAERRPFSIPIDATLLDAVDHFRERLELRLLPVIDDAGAPVGAIYERDVRRLLVNPYGHALMRNPAYGRSLTAQIKPCPIGEISLGRDRLLDHYRDSGAIDGMILTHGGILFAGIANRRMVALEGERRLAAAQGEVARAERIDASVARFEAQTAALVGELTQMARSVEAHSRETAGRAGDTGDRASAAAAAATAAGSNMGVVAERGRDLAGALDLIGDTSVTARTTAGRTVQLVGHGTARIEQLRGTAEAIDTAVALIAGIASHVNLLALNAGIEAARAGQAGRGFAVVAQEVKTLSAQTARAASAITAQVTGIHQAVDDVAGGHAAIEQAIADIAALTGTVDAAVAAQRAATRTIAANVDQAVDAADGIRNDVDAIGDSARAAVDAASIMRGFAERLGATADAMAGKVDAFLDDVRAA